MKRISYSRVDSDITVCFRMLRLLIYAVTGYHKHLCQQQQANGDLMSNRTLSYYFEIPFLYWRYFFNYLSFYHLFMLTKLIHKVLWIHIRYGAQFDHLVHYLVAARNVTIKPGSTVQIVIKQTIFAELMSGIAYGRVLLQLWSYPSNSENHHAMFKYNVHVWISIEFHHMSVHNCNCSISHCNWRRYYNSRRLR